MTMVGGRRRVYKGTGRKKIEIKKIEKPSTKSVTFSKRKKGLFKKARELEEKTGATVAVLVFSPGGKPFSCGDVDSVLKALKAGDDGDDGGKP